MLVALASGATTAHAATTAWNVDPASSKLTFTPRLAGGEFQGHFDKYEAKVQFDPHDLPHSSLVVTVDLLSARTGDGDRDTTLQGPDFFQTARWPQARFTSTAIRALGGNRYQATGQLTLRDVSRAFELPFRFDPPAPTGGAGRLAGTVTVQRLAFGVGQGEWRSTEWLDDAVRVEFSLALRPAR
jgi:polyisoprenoid-binding protein YceI